jgi:hypothetical protein
LFVDVKNDFLCFPFQAKKERALDSTFEAGHRLGDSNTPSNSNDNNNNDNNDKPKKPKSKPKATSSYVRPRANLLSGAGLGGGSYRPSRRGPSGGGGGG